MNTSFKSCVGFYADSNEISSKSRNRTECSAEKNEVAKNHMQDETIPFPIKHGKG